MAVGHRKSDIGYPFSRMSQSCQLAVVISAITSYHQGNCDHRHKSNELGQHPKSNHRLIISNSGFISYIEHQDKLYRFHVIVSWKRQVKTYIFTWIIGTILKTPVKSGKITIKHTAAGRRGGVGYISTCTGINFRPIAKPFEMRAYWSVIKRSIFLFDHRIVENWNFGHFWKKFDTFWALGASKLVKIFFLKKSKKSKKWWKFFFFIFVCIIFCLLYYVPQAWYNTRKAPFTSLNSQ